ncbi:MAG: hypothetical protein Q8P68_03340 [Candidatus Peregrinibacteria bacterium]|nr:hypothetical protein [Candidatus Peregrinibacteria bacterium]MDZ4244796.1 hypothetical protein [Candidatus Gracilibacteria bacterium]
MDIVAKLAGTDLEPSKLGVVKLPDCKSDIVINNDHQLFYFILLGLTGLFRKSIEASLIFGKDVCQMVKDQTETNGFFTSDELPGYGITRADLDNILQQVEITPHPPEDLIFFLGYKKAIAEKVRASIIAVLKEKKSMLAQ